MIVNFEIKTSKEAGEYLLEAVKLMDSEVNKRLSSYNMKGATKLSLLKKDDEFFIVSMNMSSIPDSIPKKMKQIAFGHVVEQLEDEFKSALEREGYPCKIKAQY